MYLHCEAVESSPRRANVDHSTNSEIGLGDNLIKMDNKSLMNKISGRASLEIRLYL